MIHFIYKALLKVLSDTLHKLVKEYQNKICNKKYPQIVLEKKNLLN